MEDRKGIQTSEFWVTAVTSIVTLLNSGLGWSLPTEAIATMAGVAAAYILSRGLKKLGDK